MVLETVMICMDTSEWMRNGDYSPTRLEAQSETVNYLANAKINGNAESNVGIMSMANKRIDVLVSPSRSIGQILNALKALQIGGKSNFSGALKTAQLALKNRTNKNQRQRIIMFVGSPVEDDVKELVKIGKNLKKNNVALDVINFGAENASNENAEKLEQLVNAVNSSDNSHLVNIPPGPHILADLILTSPIMVESGGSGGSAAGGAAAAGMGSMAGGIDPNMDPEMAMAIRMSMEEERQRQQKLAADKAGTAPATATATTTGAPPSTSAGTAAVAAAADAGMEDDEEAQMAAAIALSMQTAAEPTTTQDTTMTDATQADVAAAMQDPDFLNSLLSSVPGVNKDEIELDNILDELTSDTAKKDEDSKKNEDKEKK